MYKFSRVKNRRVIGVKKNLFFFSSVALAFLPLPPSLQTFSLLVQHFGNVCF